jgi:hypothetical protein
MKMRPQFNLRLRDVELFERVVKASQRSKVSMNEWIVQQVEAALGSGIGTQKTTVVVDAQRKQCRAKEKA